MELVHQERFFLLDLVLLMPLVSWTQVITGTLLMNRLMNWGVAPFIMQHSEILTVVALSEVSRICDVVLTLEMAIECIFYAIVQYSMSLSVTCLPMELRTISLMIIKNETMK